MYDNYMQNLLEENYFPYQFTYEPMSRNNNYYNQIDDYDQCIYNYDFPYNLRQKNYYSRNLATNIEKMYPEIYKIIYPMVQKACMHNSRPITEEVLDEITSDIYNNVEADNIINLNIDIINNRNEKKSVSQNNHQLTEENNNRNSYTNTNTSVQNREYRQINNPIRDLIKILLIRELLDSRPSPIPPRPFPPGPGQFPPRPPRPVNPPPSPPRPRY